MLHWYQGKSESVDQAVDCKRLLCETPARLASICDLSQFEKILAKIPFTFYSYCHSVSYKPERSNGTGTCSAKIFCRGSVTRPLYFNAMCTFSKRHLCPKLVLTSNLVHHNQKKTCGGCHLTWMESRYAPLAFMLKTGWIPVHFDHATHHVWCDHLHDTMRWEIVPHSVGAYTRAGIL